MLVTEYVIFSFILFRLQTCLLWTAVVIVSALSCDVKFQLRIYAICCTADGSTT